ncbi:MAG: hypothetical protein MJ137_06765 [Clostridia bacterium]|nr:hypothetical protein [Clostridia bacterium]
MKRKAHFPGFFLPILCTAMLILSSCTGTVAPGSGTESDAVTSEVPTETAEPLMLTSPEGKSLYLVVRADNASEAGVSASMTLLRELKKYAPDFEITTDWDRNPKKSDYEILIGKTTREGKDGIPDFDVAALGEDGYVIKAVGTKIIISGGGDAGTEAAVAEFIKMITELDKTNGIAIPSDLCIIHSGSALCTGIVIDGRPFTAFGVTVADGDKEGTGAAEAVKALLFGKMGVIFNEAESGTPGGPTGGVFLIRGNEGATNIEISVKNGNLFITGNSRTGFFRGLRDWAEAVKTEGPLKLSEGYSYKVEYGSFVTYEDYGAKGDGKTDDIEAIIAAHAAANEKKLPVLTRESAEYYIGGGDTAAVIRTDTDWSISKITIDDRNVKTVSKEVFLVPSDYSWTAVTGVKFLKAGADSIGFAPGAPSLVTAVNSNVKQYIRYGANQNSGAGMQDYILVDKDGNVDPSTPILWDFDTLTQLSYKPIEPERLFIKGGIITTIANSGHESAYYYRGIRIYRSSTTVDGLTHYVTGEGSDGQPYYGILILHSTVDCEAVNVTFTGHKTYKKIGSAGTSVSMGTYDITTTASIGFRATNCRQTNDINNSTYWGVFASNYCKNIEFDGCVFSRFDAHQGVCNVTLKNCSFGHQGVNLIGHGTALIENCRIFSSTFVNLRNDYGSTWNGDLIIRNCSYFPKNGAKADAVIIGGSNPGSHWFGYDCYLPRNILIEGLFIKDSNASSAGSPYLFSNMNSNFNSPTYKAEYPMIMPESITVSGLVTSSGKQFTVSPNAYMFAGVKINYTAGE